MVQVYEFWSFREPTCRHVSFLVSRLQAQMGDAISVTKVNVDADRQTASDFGIGVVPQVVICAANERRAVTMDFDTELPALVRAAIAK